MDVQPYRSKIMVGKWIDITNIGLCWSPGQSVPDSPLECVAEQVHLTKNVRSVGDRQEGCKTICLLFLLWQCLLWWQTGMTWMFCSALLVVFLYIFSIKCREIRHKLLEIFWSGKNKSFTLLCLCKHVSVTPDKSRWPSWTYICDIYSFLLIIWPLRGCTSILLVG